VGQGDEQSGVVKHRSYSTASHVERSVIGSILFHDENIGAGHVRDMDVVSQLPAIFVDRRSSAIEELEREGSQDAGIGIEETLSWALSDAVPEKDRRYVILPPQFQSI
jgi:hypothetical protein